MRQTSTDSGPAVSGSGSQVPLAVDLDGTLLRGDSLWEAVAILLRTRPWLLLLFPFWLLRGKAAFKAKLASEVSLDPSLLVWNEELVTFLRGQHAAGRPLFLVTGANQKWAEQIGAHFGFFSRQPAAMMRTIRAAGSANAAPPCPARAALITWEIRWPICR